MARNSNPKPMSVEEIDRKYLGRHFATLKPTGDLQKVDRDYEKEKLAREPEVPTEE
jgi:hypothetical protein